MGCFLACFGGDKERDKKPRRRRNHSSPRNQIRAKAKYRELRASPSPIKVAGEILNDSVVIKVEEKELDGSIVELSVCRENQEQGVSSGGKKKVTFDLNVKTYEDPTFLDDEEEEKEENNPEEESKVTTFPINHRYQDCGDGDDDEDIIEESDEEEGEFDEEEDEEEEEEGDDDDDDDDDVVVGTEEESYESFFSLPLENEKHEKSAEVNSPIPITKPAKPIVRDRSEYVHSVLNPVQNLSQWKEAKVKGLAPKNPEKENIEANIKPIVISPEPMFKKKHSVSDTKQEISVDASLSTWLDAGKPQESPTRSHSSVNREEQPILGALTVEDIKISSVTSSPRKSPRRSPSPDDIPIVGNVGSYWKIGAHGDDVKGIPNTTSKYREDKLVNWHATPFEVRLERALNAEGAC